MAETGLYLTESDELAIVAAGFELGCVVIPDLHYPTPRYDSLKTLEGYNLYRPTTRLFYLLSKQFLRCPLEMSKIEKGGKVGYCIGNDGGPVIQFIGGGIFMEAGSKFIRPGSIGHQAKYWNQLNGEMERPSTELVDTYKALQKLIRNSFRHSKPGKVSFWMGPEAVQAVLNGAKLVGYEKYPAQQLLE